MDENNPNISSTMNTYQIKHLSIDVVKAEIKVIKELFKSIIDSSFQNKYAGKLELVTVKKGVIMSQICRTDDKITAIPYLYSVNTSESPLILTQGKESRIFKTYMKEFDSLWKLNS